MTGNIILARKRLRRVSQRVKNICRSIRSDVHRPLFENENQKEEYSTAIFASLFVWIAKKTCNLGVLLCGAKLSDRAKAGLGGWRFLSYNTKHSRQLFTQSVQTQLVMWLLSNEPETSSCVFTAWGSTFPNHLIEYNRCIICSIWLNKDKDLFSNTVWLIWWR